MRSGAPVSVSAARGGRLLCVRLARPKANLIDREMIAALQAALGAAAGNSSLKTLLLCAEGPDFSYGASVEEHLPDRCAALLGELHRLILQIVEFPVPVLVAVRGQCLGGGCELALAGHLLFAAPDARLGQPEIRLGVFAPAASCLLPLRAGQMAAEDLLLSGRSIGADEGQRCGLVLAVCADPEEAALEYYDTHLAALSASSLRFATTAARSGFSAAVRGRLEEVESLYLRELMSSHDAVEGLSAFIAKRPPAWQDR